MYLLGQGIEALALLAALLWLRGPGERHWNYFLPFLALTLGIECAGFYVGTILHRPNLFLYNIYLPVNFIFCSLLLYNVLGQQKTLRRVFVAGAVLFALTYISEGYQTGFSAYTSGADLVSALLLVAGCGYYYYDLLSREAYHPIRTHAPFWAVTAIFMYQFGGIALSLFSSYMLRLMISPHLSLNYVLTTGLTLLLNITWIYSFRCKYLASKY